MTNMDPNKRLHTSFGLTHSQLERVFDTAVGANRDGAFCDVYLEAGVTQSLSWDQGSLKSTNNSIVCGAGVRVVIGDKQGYSFTDHPTFTNIRKSAKIAKGVAEHSDGMPEVDLGKVIGQPHNLYAIGSSPTDVELAERIDLLRQMDEVARAHDPRIKNVQAVVAVENREIVIANTLGELITDTRPLIRLGIICMAEENGRRENGSASGGGRLDFSFFYEDNLWERYAKEAAQQAIDLLQSVPAPAGEMTVVLGSGWPGVLIHEAVGHGLEGDFNRKGTSAFAGRIGDKVASEHCTVIDDGTIPGRRGSLNVDDEGVPTGKAVLIENGILRGYMQDRTNASLMGHALTGNCRRESYRHAPMPRMTNTYLANGKHNPEEIIRSVKRGIYATTFGGGQVDITSGDFTFSATGAFMIEDGKITHALKGATLIGNGPESMKNVTMVGDDSALDTGIGMCGKDGQSVPVGVGMPTVRIENVTVGGTGQ